MTTRQIENEWNTLPEDTTMTRPLRNQSSLENYDMSLNPSNVHEFVGRDLLLFPRMDSDGTVISSLTMGNFDRDNVVDRKLSVAESRIYGREHELALLENAYQRICDPGHDSEVVFVKGFTGTGKSALVESLRNPVQVRDEEPYYVYGKFDLQAKNEPFSALVNAFTEICEAILQSDELDEMKDAITEALGNDSKGMTSLISNLSIIISDGNEKGSAFSDQDVVPYSAPSSTRFRLICRAFLRAVATEKHPIIFVLDDIHWADTASVDIIKALVTDTRSKHVLIILVCRSGEVKEDSPVETLLHLESNCKLTGEKCLVSTGIDLGNLQIDTVNMIISNLTGSDLEVTLSLSKVVFRKTLGNVFFVFQFLDMLASRRLLVFSLKNQNWEWDIEKIESETTVADNVGELIVSKIQRLNQNVMEALKVAACLGSSFNSTMLRKILASELACQEGVEPNEASSEDSGEIIFKGSVDRMLEIASSEGMIENSVARYKFTHDKIQSSFYDMIPEGEERGLLHLRIGEVVLKCCMNDEDPLLFLAVDQTNRGLNFVTDERQKVDTAKLNLTVAKLAKARSAYFPASQYLRKARGLLEKECRWRKYYNLALELASLGAEMEYCSGDFLMCNELFDEVLAFSVSRRDCLRAYYAKIESLRARGWLLEALDLGFKFLLQFKISFPKKPSTIHIITSLVRASSLVPKDISDILKLPEMKDEDKMACMKIMGILAYSAFFLEKGREFILVSLEMMRFTLRFGLSAMSTQAVGTFGMIKTFVGRYDDGFAFGRLAMQLLETTKSQEVGARTILVVCCYTNHWKMPLDTLVAPLHRAYTNGLATSEIGTGLLAAYNRIMVLGSIGTPLDQMDDEILAIEELCFEFKQDGIKTMLAPTHQAVLNFQGRSTFPMILTGTIMDQVAFTEDAKNAKNQVLLHSITFAQLKLGLHFQEWSTVACLLPVIEVYRAQSKGAAKHFTVYDFILVSGIAYAVMWQQTGKKSNLRKFKRALKQSQLWLASGLKQCQANCSFLVAEEKVLQKAGVDAIIQAFDKAILDMEQAKLIHFQAFANDRAATILSELKEHTAALEYYIEARELYWRYGAHAKVDRLDSRIESLRSLANN